MIEATHDLVVQNDHIYIAPGGRHMVVVAQGGVRKILLNDAPPENGCRPAVDVMFRSVAEVYGGQITAVILTGMGSDGTQGAKFLVRAGAAPSEYGIKKALWSGECLGVRLRRESLMWCYPCCKFLKR